MGLSPDDLSHWIRDAEHELPRLPFLGRLHEVMYRRLRDANITWGANDLNDLMFLSCAAGYADVVAGTTPVISSTSPADSAPTAPQSSAA